MSKSEGFDVSRSVEELLRFSGDQLRSIGRIRMVGYGLLVLALFDTIQVFISPNFMNPNWELQTMGALVERAPVPLLGFALVFFGEDYNRTGLEDILLKLLSWVCLLLAVVSLLFVPLGINNTLRLNRINNQQITVQSQQQLEQLEAIEQQVSQGSTEQLQTLALELNRLGLSVDSTNTEGLKNEILSRIPQAREQVQTQTQQVRQNQRVNLLKNSVKWNLGALVSSALFFMIWRGTRWSR
ncbi:HpsJ-like protein, cyanoexosortase A-associated [Phormidium sp. CCY1219]|uniref:HpsJ-like protein, cyanoexosortase A-associated n=1 Tax=Phormidium sp. CCY1219 TaxID=2886104 RepID=UPI002D1EB04D|nr:HpsJ family protein [Phormidium sp. CCY1219]MEB3828725.1 HpsJ family protein [Phormidium sp. CCY1219]